jgi:flagellar motor switch protein FliG
MIYDWALARRIRCSKQDRRNCLQLVSEILVLAKSDESIQECLKEINANDLAKTFKQMNAKTQKRIFNALPKRAAAFLRETLEQMEHVPPSELAEAQERVEAVLKDLSMRPASPGLAG